MFRFTEDEKQAFAHQGHPDIAAFHHDLYRGCARDGRWSVLEQQPGPVNWARYNPAPLPGMVKLWTMEAFAHGAELVSYFRWRQFPKAQEQMHAGLLRPDARPAPALAEVREAARKIEELGDAGPAHRQAAIVFAYDAEWITQIQPQGQGRSALWAAFSSYSALRKLGLDVDIVSPATALDGYSLVVVPCLPFVPDDLADRLKSFEGQIVIGPRSGSRTDEFAIPENLAPGPLEKLVGGQITLSESWPDRLAIQIEGLNAGGWYDHYSGTADAAYTADDGKVLCWKNDNVRLCATWPEGGLFEKIMRDAARDAGLPHEPLPEGIRRRRRGSYAFTFDYLRGKVSVHGG